MGALSLNDWDNKKSIFLTLSYPLHFNLPIMIHVASDAWLWTEMSYAHWFVQTANLIIWPAIRFVALSYFFPLLLMATFSLLLEIPDPMHMYRKTILEYFFSGENGKVVFKRWETSQSAILQPDQCQKTWMPLKWNCDKKNKKIT